MSTMAQSRAWQGPALFSFGFRPFFLAGALYAALVIAAWVPWYLGRIAIPTHLAPSTWHTHELLFGYVLAVVAGFLLTAVPNWTGRLPVVGYRLIALVSLWLVGRLAVTFSEWLAPIVTAALTLAFPVTLFFVIAREVHLARNTRNYVVLAALAALVAAQALMQLEAWAGTASEISGRLGIAGAVALIMIIGGRITPSFTRNWLRKANPGREPTAPNRFDAFALVLGAGGLAVWVFASWLPPLARLPAGLLLVAAGIVHLWRLARWAPDRTFAEPLVLVLHVGYLFVPLGYVLSGLALLDDGAVPPLAGSHAWSVGAIGVMTLAVMTRATLGHTGRDLSASSATVMIYMAVTLAALARIASALVPGHAIALLNASAILWCIGFLGFSGIYGPMLIARPLR